MSGAFRYVKRLLTRAPWPTAIAILSLAVAIGASTAIFSLADALFLRPLSVREPDRLVYLKTRAETGRLQDLSYPEYGDVRSLAAFEDIAVFDQRGATYRNGEDLELLLLAAVSDNYFRLLGVRPALGRLFAPGLDRRGLSAPAVVISHRLWQRRFGGDSAIGGRAIRLSDRMYIVLGVLPPEFRGLNRGVVTDVWIDLDTWTRYYGRPEALLARSARSFEVIARLRPNATLDGADAQLRGMGERWSRDYPDAYRRRGLLAATADEVSGASGWRMTLLLVSIVALVVLIACVNVATLQLAQGDARRRELALRLAIGAAPGRLWRQLLGEAVVLLAVAAAGGILIGHWLIRAAPALLPAGPLAVDYGIALDRRVLGVTLLMVLATGIISGVVPALRASRTDVLTALKASAQGGHASVRLLSLRTGLVASQVALAVVLINAAALLLDSFLSTRNTWPGFASGKALVVLQLATGDAPDALVRWPAALEAIRERVAQVPGVTRATYVRRIPMADYGGGATLPVTAAGHSEVRGLRHNQVGPEYLETLGTRLLRGRFFASRDHTASVRVVVVNETLARQYFQGTNPLGQYLMITREPYEIIGVVEDAPISRLHEEPEPFFYVPFATNPSNDVALVVEPSISERSVTRATHEAVRATSPDARILSTTTMHDHMAAQMYREWMPAVLGTALSALGVGLALVGLYGAVALLTIRRTRELGIRLALGAEPRRVLLFVLGHGLAIAAAGGALGAALSLASGALLASIRRSGGTHDTAILLASAGSAVVIGTIASLVPARRALRIDPARTLRYE